jgi:phage terminase large subunit
VLIPSEWVQSAIDADKKLGLTITGRKRAALDVADEGADKNALACATGIRLDQVTEWSGVGSDILQTVAKAFNICDQYGTDDMRFDSDGLGAGVRGDARSLNEQRETGKITVTPWRGSAKVAKPDRAIPTAQPTGRKDRLNRDFFKNAKAQGGWELRVRFQRTHRAVTEPDYQYDPDDLIVLNGSMSNLDRIAGELSQPTYSVDTTGKIVIDKKPDGTRSPNLYDSVMILFASKQGGAYNLAEAL